MTIDQTRLEEFLASYARDSAATMHATTVVLGHRLGLFRALAAGGPQTAAQVAARTGCHPRLVREWLNAQVASAYCEYDPVADHYHLSPEQAACLADQASPTFLLGSMLAANAVHHDVDKVRDAFTGGGALGWGEHHHDMFAAGERAFRGNYQANLVDSWVPALDGVADRLQAGGRAADIGCGFGTTTILLAEGFPATICCGFDLHGPSIEAARQQAARVGVSDRVTFEVADAGNFPGSDYDLVCLFNAFHELGDPVGAARHIRTVLAPGGALMIVEPYANDAVEDNRTPVGRSFYSVSTMVCLPNAISQGGTTLLGAQAGEAALREVLNQAGFTRVRRAAETPQNLVIEAKP